MIRRIPISHIISTVCSFCPEKATFLIEDWNLDKTKILAYVCDHHNQLPAETFSGETRKGEKGA